MKLTRVVQFSAGHRYWIPTLSNEENKTLFDKWASPYNHGHNYVLEYTIKGKLNPHHNMVINIKEIDNLLKKNIVSVLDGKSINDEVDEIKIPTLENIAKFIYLKMKNLPDNISFHKLILKETHDLWAELFLIGEKTMITLTRVYEFSASHRLHVDELPESENIALFGKCNNPAGHGHNFILEVTVTGEPHETTGMICSINELDNAVHRLVIDRYDHKNLNCDLPEFENINPTSEIVTKTIWRTLDGNLPAKLYRVVLRETARNIFEYHGEDE